LDGPEPQTDEDVTEARERNSAFYASYGCLIVP
jgi:hypothetical protein